MVHRCLRHRLLHSHFRPHQAQNTCPTSNPKNTRTRPGAFLLGTTAWCRIRTRLGAFFWSTITYVLGSADLRYLWVVDKVRTRPGAFLKKIVKISPDSTAFFQCSLQGGTPWLPARLRLLAERELDDRPDWTLDAGSWTLDAGRWTGGCVLAGHPVSEVGLSWGDVRVVVALPRSPSWLLLLPTVVLRLDGGGAGRVSVCRVRSPASRGLECHYNLPTPPTDKHGKKNRPGVKILSRRSSLRSKNQ